VLDGDNLGDDEDLKIRRNTPISMGSLVYGVISLTHQFRLLFVSFVSLWFLLLIARFFTEKLYPRVQWAVDCGGWAVDYAALIHPTGCTGCTIFFLMLW
jgi:hypothetical protein